MSSQLDVGLEVLTKYLSSVSDLPVELSTLLNEMKEKDEVYRRQYEEILEMNEKILKHIETKAETTKDMKADAELEKLFLELAHKEEEGLKTSNDKVLLALKSYDLLDTSILHLDSEMTKYEASIRQEHFVFDAGNPITPEIFKLRSARMEIVQPELEAKETAQIPKALTIPLPSHHPQSPGKPSLLTADAPVDSSEPVYCICRKVSFGLMIGCDNDDCPYEWYEEYTLSLTFRFHFSCIGISAKPKGGWYCKECREMRKKRKMKK